MVLTPEQEKLVQDWRNSPKEQREWILNEKPQSNLLFDLLFGPNAWNEAYTAALALLKALSKD